MKRGLPIVELIFASELGFSTSVAGGLANEGWLATLRNSARNRTPWVSAMRKVLPIDKSMIPCCGPIKQLVGTSPKAVEPSGPTTGAIMKALGFTKLFSRDSSLPGVTALRQMNPGANPAENDEPPSNCKAVPPPESRTEKGAPDCTVSTPLVCQPPSARPLIPPKFL